MAIISPIEYEKRIAALERQCAALAAQVDRQGKVVDAAIALHDSQQYLSLTVSEGYFWEFDKAIATYRHAMAALAQGD